MTERPPFVEEPWQGEFKDLVLDALVISFPLWPAYLMAEALGLAAYLP